LRLRSKSLTDVFVAALIVQYALTSDHIAWRFLFEVCQLLGNFGNATGPRMEAAEQKEVGASTSGDGCPRGLWEGRNIAVKTVLLFR